MIKIYKKNRFNHIDLKDSNINIHYYSYTKILKQNLIIINIMRIHK